MSRRAVLAASLCAGLIGAGAARSTAPARRGAGSARSRELAPIVVAQVPATALGREALAGGTLRSTPGEGGRLVLVSPSGATRVLTSGFASAADPEVSFDGTRILFAAKKEKSDPWCIWEMKTDGGAPRRVSCGVTGARQPFYQSTVYTITPTNVEPWTQIAFVGVDGGQLDEAGAAANTSLWSCKTDGSALRRLTFNLSNDMDPVLLPDGRVVYASWLRHSSARGPQGRVVLMGIDEDGLDQQLYAADEGLRVKQAPTPTADGRVVFVEADAITGEGAGRLASVRQARPLHTYVSLTGEKDGLFLAPAPLPDGRLLVAWRSSDGAPPAGPAHTGRAGTRESTFGIYRFDLVTGAREKLLVDPLWHSLQAKLVAARPVPDARSSVVKDDDPEGKLYSVDVNIHDLGTMLPPGAARRLRIVEGVPSADRPPGRRLLGEIPLAADGSFQVQIPANTPVQLQLLDADGLAIRSSAWTWVRNHAAQGCVGCHEDPERTPPNRFVKALQSPAPVLNQPKEKRRTVSYATDVKPIVETKCRSCHAVETALDVAGVEARRSRLVWHLLGRNTARPWDPEAGATAGPAIPAGTLSADEVRTLIEWIDLGGQP